MHFSRFRFLKTSYFIGFFALLIRPAQADFDNDDKTRLTHIASDVSTIENALISNGSFTINPLQSIQYLYRDFTTAFLTSSSSWGGHFIKTVGNAAAKFTQEFGSNGWFPAVKASVGVIQADVGRIYTALTDANTQLEIIADNTASIKDNTESIDTSVTHIDSNVSSISNYTSSINDNIILLKNYLNPVEVWADGADGYAVGFNIKKFAPGWFEPISKDDFLDLFVSVNFSGSDNWASRVEQWLQALSMIEGSSNEMIANALLRESIIQYTQIASTNLLQKILDTNDVWYTRIYNKIPDSISISNQLEAVIAGISNININITSSSQDGAYTPESFNHQYGFILDNPFPSRSRDVQNANMLGMPILTGDFRRDIVLLVSYINAYSTSISSSQMDILTNVQIVANAILDARSQAEEKSRETEAKNREIIASGEALEGSIDSVSSYFDLVGGNSGISDYKDKSTTFGDVLDSTLNVSQLPDKITMRIPTFGDDSANFMEFFIDLQDYDITSMFRTIRQVMAFFWWALGFGIALFALNLGIRLVGWLSSIFFPSTYGSAITAYANNKEVGII